MKALDKLSAGAMAVKTAGENGLSVALLDRRTNIEMLNRLQDGY